MIESPNIGIRHDRLTAFLRAFALGTTHCGSARAANLLIIDADCAGRPTHLLYRARSNETLPQGVKLCAAARVDFGGSANPLIGALPEEVSVSLAEEPQLLGLAELITAEVETARCGGSSVQARLCEVVVVLAIRKAIAIGTVDAGLLAGLAHPRLSASLIAMHDEPARKWQIADLAAISGMSRGQFTAIFKQIVGESPGAYLNGWRLVLGRARLGSGESVKSVAAAVGFGSAAAFSRAYSRRFGHAPSQSAMPGGMLE
ncbi:AraC family transcriptional regulator [Afifella sp. IM 167]|nr:AraC family transcriptional regulator [Afifella sp. IM 167]